MIKKVKKPIKIPLINSQKKQVKNYKSLKRKARKRIKIGIYRVGVNTTGDILFSHFYWGRGGKRNKKRTKLFFDHIFRKKIYYAYIYKNLRRTKINIRLTPRNMFCSLVDLKNRKTYYIASAGIYKIKVSKRYRKKTAFYILKNFFNKIAFFCKSFKNVTFNIITSKRLRKSIAYFIKYKIKKIKKFYIQKLKKKKKIKKIKKLKITNTVINIVSKKSFNGCRAKKRVRLKRRKSKFLR